MPLHLLGKKSWNVYNTDNIERVKRDEAIAAAREAAEEERMQELDAERRMQILRGEVPTPLPITSSQDDQDSQPRREDGRERKRRKKAGENDTDFEMRVVREDAKRSEQTSQLVLRKDSGAPLTDHKGHISLFPESQPKRQEKNAEAEAEAAKKKKEYEDQYTMRFSNAAGFKQDIGGQPWYSKAGREDETESEVVVGKDIWGNEDPRRKEREVQRLVSSDPLAMMKAGAAQVRHVEKERKKWREEKERELEALKKEDRRRRKRRRDEEDDLDSFRLDDGESRREHRDGDRSREKEREHKRRDSDPRRSSFRGDDRHKDRHKSSHSHSHRHRHHDR
ncbi:uncharacterized protein LY89DRAFT_648528 [Mollisia scopiformis]|uniref:CBF1-interacting co-repressor CIR N-terminal domain-containing protein n=1 Tax=Mollisia scopiformis TaxID=149040 RepID=A0A194X543_MOLSC|nr:uncharacterized protein LY89DRAFT_648528 [Mollisia scopiformis]KUJ15300.1 hypothetical protein LY89DRAFT_648528 [Mollisia scopiformis]